MEAWWKYEKTRVVLRCGKRLGSQMENGFRKLSCGRRFRIGLLPLKSTSSRIRGQVDVRFEQCYILPPKHAFAEKTWRRQEFGQSFTETIDDF